MNNAGCSSTCNSASRECGYEISCFQKIAGTLTGDEIKKHELIKPQDTQYLPKYQTTTVDLNVGDGHYIYDGLSTNAEKKWRLVFIGTESRLAELNERYPHADKYVRPNTDKPQTLSIPPYGSAFVQLNEEIDTYTVAKNTEVPLLVVGRFDLKLSAVHQGLISQQATQIEPCYKGKLFCFIHNLSNKNIELTYGDRIATIEFSYVSCFCDKDKKLSMINTLIDENEIKYGNEYCNGTGIDDVRYFYYNNKLPNDCGLLSFKKDFLNRMNSQELIDDLAVKVDAKIERRRKWLGIILPVAVSLIVFLLGSLFKNAEFEERLTKTESEIETLKIEKASWESKYNELFDSLSIDQQKAID